MHKVVINVCYGGFSLSREASNLMNQLYGTEIDPEYGFLDGIPRHHKGLVGIVEILGSSAASGSCSRLVVVEIKSNMYRIEEYDGYESIVQPDDYQHWEIIKEEN